MKSHKLLVTLSFSLLLSGCDRLSERDKMEMIAKCDSEARKKLKEVYEADHRGSVSVKVETHYSFGDRKCYALERTVLTLTQTSETSYREILYDGLTKQELLKAVCKKRRFHTRIYSYPRMETLAYRADSPWVCLKKTQIRQTARI